MEGDKQYDGYYLQRWIRARTKPSPIFAPETVTQTVYGESSHDSHTERAACLGRTYVHRRTCFLGSANAWIEKYIEYTVQFFVITRILIEYTLLVHQWCVVWSVTLVFDCCIEPLLYVLVALMLTWITAHFSFITVKSGSRTVTNSWLPGCVFDML